MINDVSFFVTDILDPENWLGFTEGQREAIGQYLDDLQRGPADGEMDIEWQETGRSYYVHLLRLTELEGDVRDAYLERLQHDINACSAIWPNNYAVRGVAEKVTTVL